MKRANIRTKESLQLAIYGLSWYRLFGKIPKICLIFLESGVIGEYELSLKDLDKTEEKYKIEEVIKPKGRPKKQEG
ncbi:MAG: hypothetical protein AB1630_02955 [bacterium]